MLFAFHDLDATKTVDVPKQRTDGVHRGKLRLVARRLGVDDQVGFVGKLVRPQGIENAGQMLAPVVGEDDDGGERAGHRPPTQSSAGSALLPAHASASPWVENRTAPTTIRPMTATAPATPRRELRHVVIDARVGFGLADLREVWKFRELLLVLAWRDIQVRYSQTVIGASWAIVQPLISMLVFTVIFSRFAHFSSGGIPYPVLAFVGVLPWQLFSQALAKSTTSLVASGSLISKTYFPRLIVPLATLGAPIFDFGIALVMLAVLMAAYGQVPHLGVVFLPAFMLLAVVTSAACGLWLSAVHARYRDVGQLVPFFLQIGMYLAPVGYPLSAVPAHWRSIYSLNPLCGVIQGFRWGLLGDKPPELWPLAVSTAVVVILLVSGVRHFGKAEATVVDVL